MVDKPVNPTTSAAQPATASKSAARSQPTPVDKGVVLPVIVGPAGTDSKDVESGKPGTTAPGVVHPGGRKVSNPTVPRNLQHNPFQQRPKHKNISSRQRRRNRLARIAAEFGPVESQPAGSDAPMDVKSLDQQMEVKLIVPDPDKELVPAPAESDDVSLVMCSILDKLELE